MADLLVRVLDLLPGGVGELLFGVCGLRRHPLPAIIPASLPAQICSYVSFIIPFYGEIMFGVLVFLAFCGGAPVPPSSFLASPSPCTCMELWHVALLVAHPPS